MNRLLVNICSEDLTGTKDFYTGLFDFEVAFDSDWFINLKSGNQNIEIGIIDPSHDIVPGGLTVNPDGFYLTFVVDDVDRLYKETNHKIPVIVKLPHDTFYGQRRMVIKDPNGVNIDVSSPTVG